jgi:outer membrane protein TolC
MTMIPNNPAWKWMVLLPLAAGLAWADAAAPRAIRGGRLPLPEAIELGLKRNPQLELQRERIGEAAAGLRAEDAAFDPSVGADLRASTRRDAGASSELDGSSQPQRDTLTAGADLSKPLRDGSTLSLEWDALDRSESNSSFSRLNPAYDSALRVRLTKPLLLGGGREALLPGEFAATTLQRSGEEWRAEIETVVAEIERGYWGIALRTEARLIRDQGLSLARLILEETLARETARVEVLEARANVVRREAELAAAEKELQDARDALFRSLGILATDEPGNLALDRLPPPGGAAPDPDRCYTEALREGVDARLEENRLARARLEVEQARLRMRPTLDLAASGGFLGRDGRYGESLRALGQGDGRFLEAGLELRFPWDLRAERERLHQADSRLRQEERAIESQRLELFARLRELCRRVNLGLAELRAARTAVELNQARFEEQRARRAAGQAILRDVLEAQTAMDEARLAELRARTEILDARIELDNLRGALPARHGLLLELPPASPSLPARS